MKRSGGAHPTTAAAEAANGLVHAGGEADVRIVRVVREVCEAEVEAEAAEIINGRCRQGGVEVGPEAWGLVASHMKSYCKSWPVQQGPM
jgi:hypothetical protein